MAESRKRKKVYYDVPHSKRKKPGWMEDLCPGMTGILITTNDQEKLCVSEAYNILNEYADQLYGPESPLLTEHSDDMDKDLNVETAIAREVQSLRGSKCKPRRFQATSSGAKHVVFIQCRPPVDPVTLVHHIFSDVMKTEVRKTRFCQRVIPVSVICHATPEDIKKKVTPVFAPHFYQNDRVLKFAVHYKVRNNTDVNRDDIIKLLASLVTQNGEFSHTVDLSNPDLSVVVEIVKNNCCISVVRDFVKMKRYNIQSVMETFSENHPKTEAAEPNREKDDGDKESVCDGDKHKVDGDATQEKGDTGEGGKKEGCDSKVKELDSGSDGGKNGGSVEC